MLEPEEERDRARWSSLLATPEGYVLVSGLALASLGAAALIVPSVFWPETFQPLIGMTATHLAFGRAAGISIGYAAGFGHTVVISVNMLIETVLVLVFYPIFVFGWRRLLDGTPLRNMADRTRRAAERHSERIRRFGMLGLLFFVWLPFWMTGPLVGSAIGFLIGLQLWVNLTVVLSGTFLAIVCWALFLNELHELAEAYGPYGPYALVGILVSVVLLGMLRRWRSAL